MSHIIKVGLFRRRYKKTKQHIGKILSAQQFLKSHNPHKHDKHYTQLRYHPHFLSSSSSITYKDMATQKAMRKSYAFI